MGFVDMFGGEESVPSNGRLKDMAGKFTVAKSGFSRVYIIPGRAGPEHRPQYEACGSAGSLDKSFGDVEREECPSEEVYGEFDVVARTQGAEEDASSSLVLRYASDAKSTLLKLAAQRCPADVHVHFGKCTDPRVFNAFTKAIIYENVHLTSYSTDDLGAIQSDENAAIMETIDLTIAEVYETVPLTIQERAPDVVINQLTDAVICDYRTCGDCNEYSEGCNDMFVLQGGLLGSPGTAPDIVYSDDEGNTWGSDEIVTLTSGQIADAIACLGNYLVVVSNAAGSASYKLKSYVLAGTALNWEETTVGFVSGSGPNDIWSVGVGAWIVGDGGYVYYMNDPSLGVVIRDAGVAAGGENLNAIHALSDNRAVAVGENDTIIYTTDGETWEATNATGGGNNLTTVWMRSLSEWWVGDDAGNLYYTKDSGNNWTAKALPGTAPTGINDIQFASESIGYVVGAAGGSGSAWRTFDAGYDWVKLPEGAGSLPGSSTTINALATCQEDVDIAVFAAQDAANDGVLLIGKA
ncbi:hypothetical protein GF380_01765 [Candidatus Uhrbacteria bacterium]|nr:hypothetical protein [Candidatus Uhrbacteria bacterium]